MSQMKEALEKAGDKCETAIKATFDTRKAVSTLENLMTRVTGDNCTPETVNAACNCADKIVQFLRLHLDVERLRARTMGRRDEGV